MQIHQIQQRNKNKKRMTVARGGKRGKTAGRGTKGQKARAGHKIRPEMRDIIKRIPKMRGRGKNSNMSVYEKPVVINLVDLESVFSAGDTISRHTLLKKGVIKLKDGRLPEVKLLGTGDFSKKVTVKNIMMSASVKAKIEKAGGTIA